jgi:hypothetical protein
VALSPANSLTHREIISECAPTLTWQVQRALHLWHLVSLDAPTVAVVWALAFARVAGVHLDQWVLVLLASGTWTVYVADRLLDARRAIRSGRLDALRERHYFHWRYRRLLIPVACVTAAITAELVARRMPVAVRSRDSLLATAALIYFSGVHSATKLPQWLRKLVSKELLVGLLFTAGCAAPTLSRPYSARWPFFACLLFFVALAWLNCTAIESWESSMNQTRVFLHTFVLGVICLAASGAFVFMDARASALACSAAISALLLSLLDRTRTNISSLTLRTLADLVLLTPFAFVILGAR